MFEDARKAKEAFKKDEALKKAQKAQNQSSYMESLEAEKARKSGIYEANKDMIQKVLEALAAQILDGQNRRVTQAFFSTTPAPKGSSDIPNIFYLVFSHPEKVIVSVQFTDDFTKLTVKLEIGTPSEPVVCESISEEKLVAAITKLIPSIDFAILEAG